jgi:hypothetical protein
MNTISKPEYERLKKLHEEHEKWRGGRSSYPVDSVPEHLRITNEQRSQIEVYEFVNNPPDTYFLYISEKDRVATTWTGDKLGVVLFGSEYESPAFGRPSKRVPVKIKAINGFTYNGTYYKSAGDYARVKMDADSRRRLQNTLNVA